MSKQTMEEFKAAIVDFNKRRYTQFDEPTFEEITYLSWVLIHYMEDGGKIPKEYDLVGNMVKEKDYRSIFNYTRYLKRKKDSRIHNFMLLSSFQTDKLDDETTNYIEDYFKIVQQ